MVETELISYLKVNTNSTMVGLQSGKAIITKTYKSPNAHRRNNAIEGAIANKLTKEYRINRPLLPRTFVK